MSGMRLNLPHRKQTKRRSDIALTKSLAYVLVEHIRAGKPYLSREHRHLLAGGAHNSPPISKNTYSSWMRRGTKPVGCRKSLHEMVEKARLLRLADEAVEQLDRKKIQKIFDLELHTEKTEVFKFGGKPPIEITTSGTDMTRAKIKLNTIMRILDKVEPLPKRPDKKEGLTLEKMRWGERKYSPTTM